MSPVMKFHFCQNYRYEFHTRNKFQTHMPIKRNIQRDCDYSFGFGQILFTWKSHASLKFHFGQNDRYEIYIGLSFIILTQFIWTQVKSWRNTEVRFSIKMKSLTALSSCERILKDKAKRFEIWHHVSFLLIFCWRKWYICSTKFKYGFEK